VHLVSAASARGSASTRGAILRFRAFLPASYTFRRGEERRLRLLFNGAGAARRAISGCWERGRRGGAARKRLFAGAVAAATRDIASGGKRWQTRSGLRFVTLRGRMAWAWAWRGFCGAAPRSNVSAAGITASASRAGQKSCNGGRMEDSVWFWKDGGRGRACARPFITLLAAAYTASLSHTPLTTTTRNSLLRATLSTDNLLLCLLLCYSCTFPLCAFTVHLRLY